MGQIKNIKLHIVTDIKTCVLATHNHNNMQIFVNGSTSQVYDVSPNILIQDLKELISFRSGVQCDDQVLTYAGRPLVDDLTLSEGGLQEECTVYLGERLLGGKVHGSLARAGKVKGDAEGGHSREEETEDRAGEEEDAVQQPVRQRRHHPRPQKGSQLQRKVES